MKYRTKYGNRRVRAGDVERAAVYKADFTYYTDAGEYVVEDAKGYRTPDYVLKRKLMLYGQGIRVREV